jgi:transcriptional regulator with XRE-family HTH domain
VRIEDYIGSRIKARRESLDLTLEAVGKALEPHLGNPWTPQGVWQAENGKRDFRISHLLAFALALDVPLSWLLTPPRDESVTLSTSRELKPNEVRDLFPVNSGPQGDVDSLVDAMYEMDNLDEQLGQFIGQLTSIQRNAWAVRTRIVNVLTPAKRRGGK